MVAIFASGTGSNAVNLVRHFNGHASIRIGLLVCNKADAPVVAKARELGVDVLISDNASFEEGVEIVASLREHHIDWIVLAGFLRKIPLTLIRAYENRIINIHPALLPKFGGKGMYGMFVHQAVVEAQERETGITIHFVNEEFDKGEIVEQFAVLLDATDTPEVVAKKVQELEHTHFPAVVERIISKH